MSIAFLNLTPGFIDSDLTNISTGSEMTDDSRIIDGFEDLLGA